MRRARPRAAAGARIMKNRPASGCPASARNHRGSGGRGTAFQAVFVLTFQVASFEPDSVPPFVCCGLYSIFILAAWKL